MKTFDDIGMPFPLFRGPVSHAFVDEPGACEICGAMASIRFREACYSCFRSGKVDHAVDTELGMVLVEDAKAGLTHGLPLRDPPKLGDYELVPHPVDPNFPDQKWFHVRVDADKLLELVRTPTYLTWQGECWQFCCMQPAIFLGSLPVGAVPESENSPVDAIVNWFKSPNWSSIAEGAFGSVTYYVFRCPSCNKIRFHQDMD